MLRAWSQFVHLVSFEWLLDSRANGGDIILLRSLLIALAVYLLAIGIKHGIDPTRIASFDLRELQLEVGRTIPWLGAIFAAAYVALYARFSSQWMYLADVYNRIKEAEARTARDDYPGSKEAIAAWKAGFIEDASELHLATKSVFVSILRAWGETEEVKRQFIANTPGGEHRFNALMERVRAAYKRHEDKFVSPSQRKEEQLQEVPSKATA